MRDKIRDIVVQAVAGTKDLTEAIDELHDLLDDRQSEQLSQYNSFVNMQYHSVELDDTDITDFTDWINCG